MSWNVDCVRVLLEAGANVHANSNSALSSAVVNGNLDCIHLLLEAGANVDGAEYRGLPILDWAYINLESNDAYWMILPSSQKAKTFLTISGILHAANRGSRALSQYISMKETNTV